MGSPSDAPEGEPYRRALEAVVEVAQVLLTLHTVATLDAKNMTPLVVENITALLDDLQRGHPTSQRLREFRQAFDERRAILIATAIADLDREAAAYWYWRLGQALLLVENAFRGVQVARIGALAEATRSKLDHAIRSAKDAFWQLARTEGPADPALLTAIGRMRAASDDFSSHLDNLRHELTTGVRDGVNSSVAVVDSQPRERPSAADEARRILHQPPGHDLHGGMNPFDPLGR
jgi:hypothetical protein